VQQEACNKGKVNTRAKRFKDTIGDKIIVNKQINKRFLSLHKVKAIQFFKII